MSDCGDEAGGCFLLIYSYMCLWAGLFVCTRPPNQTKTVGGPTFVFFFEKFLMRAASLKKLPTFLYLVSIPNSGIDTFRCQNMIYILRN